MHYAPLLLLLLALLVPATALAQGPPLPDPPHGDAPDTPPGVDMERPGAVDVEGYEEPETPEPDTDPPHGVATPKPPGSQPPEGAPAGWFKPKRQAPGKPTWLIHDWSLRRLVGERQAREDADGIADDLRIDLERCRGLRLEDVQRMQAGDVGWPWYVHTGIWLGGIIAAALVDRYLVDLPAVETR